MAAELSKAFDVTPRLIKGGRGVFDVHVDGALIYSKHKTGRFPTEGEVEKLFPSPT